MTAPVIGGWIRADQSGSTAAVADVSAVPAGAWMLAFLVVGANIEPAAFPTSFTNFLSTNSFLTGSRRSSIGKKVKGAETSISWTTAAGSNKSLWILWGVGADPDVSTWTIGLIGVRNATNVVSGQSVQAGTGTTSVAPGVSVAAADCLVVSVMMEATLNAGTFLWTSGGTKWFESAENGSFIEALVAAYATPSPGTTGATTATAQQSQASNGWGVQIVIPPAAAPPEDPIGVPVKTGDGETAWLSYIDGSGERVAPARVGIWLPGFTDVDAALAKSGATMAHRCGSLDMPELSEYAGDRSVMRGYGILELSAQRTSDGQWPMMHDNDFDRISGVSGSPAPSTMTWATLQSTYQITLNAGGRPRPFWRLDEALDKYRSTHVLMADPKNQLGHTSEFLDLLDAHGGPEHIIVKYFGVGSGSTALADAAALRGYQTWGYFYEADYLDGDLAANQSHWSILGMEYSASAPAWAAVTSYGKPVIGHIAPNQAAYDAAMSKGARWVQCSGVNQIAPVSAWN